MTNDTPDWTRLQKALTIEAEQGFTDLMGRQYRFSEFLTLTFGKFPAVLPSTERRRWQELAAQFASYPNLVSEDRQHSIGSPGCAKTSNSGLSSVKPSLPLFTNPHAATILPSA